MMTKLNGSVNLLAEAMRKVFQEGVEKAVEPVRKEMREQFGQVNKRFDQTDKRFDQVNKRFDKMDSRLDHHQKALDGIKDREVQAKKVKPRSARA